MAAKTALDTGQQKGPIPDEGAFALPVNDPHFHGPALVSVRQGTIGGAEVQTVNARELHAYLGNRDHFSSWIADRIEQFGFAQGADYETYSESTEKGGRPRIEYVTTLDMAKELSMVERTAKGKDARLYFIACERRVLPAVAAPALPDFADPVAMARAWADAVEGRQKAHMERDRAIATKSEIGTRREATAMARASTAVREANRLKAELGRSQTHATVLAVERASRRSFGQHGWRLLRKWCDDHGLTPESVHDPRYGTVRAWPADAWGSVYSIDLSELFPAGE